MKISFAGVLAGIVLSVVGGNLGSCTSVTKNAQTPAQVQLITLDPGHFHASLVQKFMYPQVNPVVYVYAPEGDDVQQHLKRITAFNGRADNPTHWQEKVYTGSDYLQRMLAEQNPYNFAQSVEAAPRVVVIAGNNAHKDTYITASINAGLNVLSDKPMAIDPAGFGSLRKAFDSAQRDHVLLYDIMTERYEITATLQRELSELPDLFGSLQNGNAERPAITEESVHHLYKEVAGVPLTRPAWYFDVTQQGEGIVDVTTHLVDLIQWECFPEQKLDWKKDVNVYAAKHWATHITSAEFKKVTGLDNYPDFLKKNVGPDGVLNVFTNGRIDYTLKDVYARVSVTWDFEAPPGTGDTHYSMMRGSRANLIIKQGKEQNYKPMLYVENNSGKPDAEFEKTLTADIAKLATVYPGIGVQKLTGNWQITIPASYDVGHEAHFAQVTEKYLKFLADGKLPDWEVPGMLAKYYTTTKAYELSR